MKKLSLLLTALLFMSTSQLLAQTETSLKEQAIEEFKKEHYDEAIALLEKAVKETPHRPTHQLGVGRLENHDFKLLCRLSIARKCYRAPVLRPNYERPCPANHVLQFYN